MIEIRGDRCLILLVMSRGDRSFDVAGYVGSDRLWGESRDILGDRFVIGLIILFFSFLPNKRPKIIHRQPI